METPILVFLNKNGLASSLIRIVSHPFFYQFYVILPNSTKLLNKKPHKYVTL